MRHGLFLISAIALSTLLMAAKAAPPSSLEGYWKASGTISAKSGKRLSVTATGAGGSARLTLSKL
jgi:hypothetical protein